MTWALILAFARKNWQAILAAVLIAHVAGRANAVTALGAQIYFWGRVAYVPLYAFGVPPIRSLVWLLSLAGLIMVASQILLP